MTLLQAIILGVVEGVTEFLPISSTGHLILASRLLGLSQTDFQKSFEIAIQLGAIASVIVLYWRRFLEPAVVSRVLVAFLPTGLIGFALYRVVKTYLFDSEAVVLWALGLGGVALIVFELLHREGDDAVPDVASISYSKAFLIGVFQSLSIVPGVSRAGATIVGGLILGLSRSTIVEFSFLLAVPTMLAATGYDLLKNASTFATATVWCSRRGFRIVLFRRTPQHQVLARLCPHKHLHPIWHLPHRGRARFHVSLSLAKHASAYLLGSKSAPPSSSFGARSWYHGGSSRSR